jgi:hypothetical protein
MIKPITARKIHPASTERKRAPDSIKEKIEQYKKIIDKKINEISNSSNLKGLNKSALAGVDFHNTTNDRNISHHSILTNNKSKKIYLI